MAALELVLARRGDAVYLAQMSRRLVEAGLEPCWTERRIDRQRADPDSLVLTARIGATIGGFAIMQYGDEAAHLNLLAVEKVHQRRGIGRALVAWLEDTARAAGVFRIRLEVRAGNQAAQDFYAALGYREAGWVSGYYQGEEDALRFERDLAVARAPAPGAGGTA
jgi:ribosomal protein S18 acetylase RimI-like enzyme